jgi:serine/threonine protein kinase/tetratricopeptide (TPR) repeat protein
MTDPPSPLMTALAGRYTLQRELGRGGMATVYLATDLKHERPVALKVLKPELAAVLGADRFLREVKTTAQLTHPHILPLHDSGNADGFLYYVMPYVEGESLRDRLNREKQLPLDDALQISREVADALSYAHSHGVIHRDIKPENILLESGHAVVADFGIARAIDQAGGEKLTGTGIALGTPAYMSPEQAAGSRDLDGRSDLYSLGCVLYEMLAGQPPFTGPTVESLVHQHLAVEPPNITVIRPAVPAQVAATLQRALAKTPADRFNPVALFAEALGPRGSAASSPTAVTAATRSWPKLVIGGVTLVVLAVVGTLLVRRPGGEAAVPPASVRPRTAIAVLPFENLSGEGPNAYFAGGLHDELITQLTKVAALKPISRTSVMEYATRTKPLKQIADELSVGTIIEGSVQVVGERLRVNVQLIDAATDQHLWAERYDRTLDDAFAVQSDIAQQIVTAVGAALAGPERAAIAEAPTANAEAYRLYLQGLEYWRRPGYFRRNWEIAQDLYERALALDSTFALAHAALSLLHGRMAWFGYDPSPERLVRQRVEAETALRLAPNLPQAHSAMGSMHGVGRGDWTAALKEYRIALEGLPNDAASWAAIAVAVRLGRWDEAVAAVDKAVLLDPRNADLLGDRAFLLHFLRRYHQAVEWFSRSLALAPDVAENDVDRGWTWVVWQGRLDSLGAALDRHPPDTDLGASGSASAWRALQLFWERKPDSLLALLRRTPQPVFEGQWLYLPAALYAAWAHQLRGDDVAARAAFDSAQALLDSAAAVRPNNWPVHAARGLALAGLGRRREAQGEARWLRQSKSYREDAHARRWLAEERARILAGIDDADAALEEIERLLAGPAYGLSVHTLRLDPRWDPIRNDPRFQALLVKYANPEPVR